MDQFAWDKNITPRATVLRIILKRLDDPKISVYAILKLQNPHVPIVPVERRRHIKFGHVLIKNLFPDPPRVIQNAKPNNLRSTNLRLFRIYSMR